MNFINTLIIGPLKILFCTIYTVAYYFTGSAGLSIVALSFVMNVLLLPLYNRSDSVQDEQMQIEKKLKPGVDHIKKAFKGDEQYMILSTYYRQNNYSQLDILKGSISLILEVPFFIAAYSFLSELNVIKNTSFGVINNLGAPDQLLNIGVLTINVLPILMTLINVISCMVYTKGQPLKSKIQLYAMALVFLVLLYDAPSGLAFYYLLNNIFSLIKNIFNKLPNKHLIISILCTFVSVVGIIMFLILPLPLTTMVKTLVCVFLILLNIPLLVIMFGSKINYKITLKSNKKIFYISLAFICVFIGLFIPCEVIKSSTNEFVDNINLTNPLEYVFNTLLLSVGTFMVWINVYYLLMPKKIKNIINLLMPMISLIAFFDYMLFGNNLGLMSNMLIYDNGMSYSLIEMLLNVLCSVVVIALVYFLVNKKIKALNAILEVLLISSIVLSVVSGIKINNEAIYTIDNYKKTLENSPEVHLSKDKQNVIVITLDRAINSYFPYFLEEKPILKEQFAGFTYYPNTISFGAHTVIAAPAMYGGYEYTPDEINNRSNELLIDKHNQALMLMPVIFGENDYSVTVCDQPYANYLEPGDFSIYDEYQNIQAYNVKGRYKSDEVTSSTKFTRLNTLLFSYGITRSVPVILQNVFYNYGVYNDIDYYNKKYNGFEGNPHYRNEIGSTFLNAYTVLQNLNNMTSFDGEKGSLFVLNNDTTHEVQLLQEPEYGLTQIVDNYEYDLANSLRVSIEGNEKKLETYNEYSHYESNMAAMLELGKYFDYLRENDVYDNTKIIIVADHGYTLSDENTEKFFSEEQDDLEQYNPLLLVKDYNSKEFNIDYSFMTNADVPTLAFENLIDNPINPFTGKPITNEDKFNKELLVFFSKTWSHDTKKYVFDYVAPWYTVNNNIFDRNNWTKTIN